MIILLLIANSQNKIAGDRTSEVRIHLNAQAPGFGPHHTGKGEHKVLGKLLHIHSLQWQPAFEMVAFSKRSGKRLSSVRKNK